MLTLKDKINRILGDNVRLLLPSYWWKRLFGMVVDRIDEVHPIVDSAAALDKLDVPDGSIASITGEMKSFRTCYQIPEEILSGSGDDDDLLPELPKLTRINNISILNPLPSEAILIILCERDKLSVSGLFLTPDLSYFSSSYEGVVTKIIIAEGGVVNPVAESQINDYLEKNELCYVYANTDSGGVNTSATYDIVDKVLKQGVKTDVYIKDEEWQPLARRKELDSLRTSIEGIEESGVELRDLYIYENYDGTLTELTNEQKAWNLETLELAKQGKAIVRATLHGNTFILELFNEDNDYQFRYTQFSPSGGIAVSVHVAKDGLSGIKIEESHFDSELSTTSTNAVQNKVITAALNNKVDKVTGKQLSTEDFTSALKTKLEGLNNYDDTEINNALSKLQTQLDTLVSGDASTAIESFNEIIAFLSGITDSEGLDAIIASIEQQIAKKVDKVEGKGLSTEDYTTKDKTKLEGIEEGAQKNVQSDWNEDDETSSAFIKNKPVIEVDSSMSDTSEKAVQNKVIKSYVDNAIANAITATLNTAV